MSQLVDCWGREHTYLRVAVTDRCNLRCGYCMPPEGIAWRQREEILRLEEIYRLARIFAELGITKIRLTGGEPTLRRDIEWLIKHLVAIPGIDTVALTTNGVLLGEKAAEYKACGLHAINVSLDTLQPERFIRITGSDRHREVMAGIEAALAAGFTPLKLNVVVMGGINDDEVLDFVEFALDKPVNVRFIEYMPFRGNGWQQAKFISYREMLDTITARYPLTPVPADASAVAKDYRIDAGRGTVSFITPVSAHFCDSCTRLRLTADGSVKTCLFHPAEINLRDLLRDGTPDVLIAGAIRDAVVGKPLAHPSVEELEASNSRCMSQIGG
ncbi:MAG: GTP 3',8-cyclase MoaA [Armatimonadota bacterium]